VTGVAEDMNFNIYILELAAMKKPNT